jgi:hypothetical protein
VQWAILQGNCDKNFDQALSRIVSDLQGLSVSADNKPWRREGYNDQRRSANDFHLLAENTRFRSL